MSKGNHPPKLELRGPVHKIQEKVDLWPKRKARQYLSAVLAGIRAVEKQHTGRASRGLQAARSEFQMHAAAIAKKFPDGVSRGQ